VVDDTALWFGAAGLAEGERRLSPGNRVKVEAIRLLISGNTDDSNGNTARYVAMPATGDDRATGGRCPRRCHFSSGRCARGTRSGVDPGERLAWDRNREAVAEGRPPVGEGPLKEAVRGDGGPHDGVVALIGGDHRPRVVEPVAETEPLVPHIAERR
jgi:hypothetical protein